MAEQSPAVATTHPGPLPASFPAPGLPECQPRPPSPLGPLVPSSRGPLHPPQPAYIPVPRRACPRLFRLHHFRRHPETSLPVPRSGSGSLYQNLRWPPAHLPHLSLEKKLTRTRKLPGLVMELPGAWLPAARACESGQLGLAKAAADRRSSRDCGGWCPGEPAAPSSRPREAPGPHRGMDEGKMDENEWRYHGEGNKSLVVAHEQVRNGLLARFEVLTLSPVGSLSPRHPLRLSRFPIPPGAHCLRVSFPVALSLSVARPPGVIAPGLVPRLPSITLRWVGSWSPLCHPLLPGSVSCLPSSLLPLGGRHVSPTLPCLHIGFPFPQSPPPQVCLVSL